MSQSITPYCIEEVESDSENRPLFLQIDSRNLIFQIILGIILTIVVTYFLLPRITHSQSLRYFGLKDIYFAIYFGLIISAVQLFILFFAVLFFAK